VNFIQLGEKYILMVDNSGMHLSPEGDSEPCSREWGGWSCTLNPKTLLVVDNSGMQIPESCCLLYYSRPRVE